MRHSRLEDSWTDRFVTRAEPSQMLLWGTQQDTTISGPSFSLRCKHISKSQHLKFKIKRDRGALSLTWCQKAEGNLCSHLTTSVLWDLVEQTQRQLTLGQGRKSPTVCFQCGLAGVPTEEILNSLELLAERRHPQTSSSAWKLHTLHTEALLSGLTS